MPSNSYPLKKGAVGSSGTAATCGRDDGPLLPLWTSFNCNLMAQPKCAEGPRITGFVNVQVCHTVHTDGLALWMLKNCMLLHTYVRTFMYIRTYMYVCTYVHIIMYVCTVKPL